MHLAWIKIKLECESNDFKPKLLKIQSDSHTVYMCYEYNKLII